MIAVRDLYVCVLDSRKKKRRRPIADIEKEEKVPVSVMRKGV